MKFFIGVLHKCSFLTQFPVLLNHVPVALTRVSVSLN
jgi:hypothetical protein